MGADPMKVYGVSKCPIQYPSRACYTENYQKVHLSLSTLSKPILTPLNTDNFYFIPFEIGSPL